MSRLFQLTYFVYNYPTDESQQIPTETGSAQTDISHRHDTTESSRELEYVQQVADDKIGEQPRVEGTAMLGNKNNGTTESSSTLRSVHQTAGDKMSSDVEQPQPGVIKTGESYFFYLLGLWLTKIVLSLIF